MSKDQLLAELEKMHRELEQLREHVSRTESGLGPDGRNAGCLAADNSLSTVEMENHGRPAETMGLENDGGLLEIGRDLLENLFSSTHCGVVVYDCDFYFRRVNQTFADWASKDKDYFKGKRHFDLYPHEENETIFRQVLQTMKSHTVYAQPFEYPDEDNPKMRYRDWTLQPLKNKQGKAVGLLLIQVDVTDRALSLARQNLLVQLLDSVRESIVASDMDANITYWGRGAELLFGYDRAEMLGQSIRVIMPQETEGHLRPVFEHVLAHGFWTGQGKRRRKDGSSFWADIVLSLIKDQDGLEYGLISIHRDITEQRLAEEMLGEKSGELGKRVKELNCLFEMSKLVETNHYEIEDVMNGLLEIIPTAWQYSDITSARIILGNKTYQSANFTETTWRQASSIMVEGKPRGLLEVYYHEKRPEDYEGPFLKEERGLINVIAERLGRLLERNRAEQKLRDSEERYRAVFEQAGDSIALISPENGKIIEFNRRACETLEYTPEEFERLRVKDFQAPGTGENNLKQLEKAQEDGSATHETRFRTKSGKLLDVHVNSKMIRLGDRELLVGIWRDITEQKRAEERIHTLSQELIKAQENERQLISRDLHDNLAQDLSSLKIVFETLFDGHNYIPPEIEGKLHEVSRILEASIRAVRDLAHYLRPPSLDQLGLVKTISQYFEEFNNNFGVTVDFYSIGIEQLQLDSYTEINLYRIIQEVFNNIIKHARANYVTIRMAASYPKIILRIEDDGHGFDVRDSGETIHERRLGLNNIEERVKLLDGLMKIQSFADIGTKIYIEIPFTELVDAH